MLCCFQRKAHGQELLDLVFKNLDLVEKDYFGLQFMDTHQVSVSYRMKEVLFLVTVVIT